MILKIFFFGMLGGFVAILLEKGFQGAHSIFTASPNTDSILAIFLGGALIEEYAKYLAIRIGVFKNSALDEAPDLMLYMIISALGFAALENILVLSNFHPILSTAKVIEMMGIRFVSAPILHALCSGVLGYFLAMSFHHTKKRYWLFFLGLGISSVLHGMYNFSIIKIDSLAKFIVPLFILIAVGFIVSLGFKRLKRMKNTCKVIPQECKP
jgi:RsiW-degrading membrane proteinase PrsW (M82 family)